MKYKKRFYFALGLLLILFLSQFSSCTKPDERIEMGLIVNIWTGCNPPMYNTAIITLNNTKYTFNLERVDGAYMSTNTILIDKGGYNVELTNIEGMQAHEEQNGLNGAVVHPKKYETTYFKDDVIRTQGFCNNSLP